ncbi:MAG: class I SAM-dependent methyltransferase [Anaerolineales bacterium]
MTFSSIKTFLRRISFNLWYYRDPPWDTGISPPELLAFLDAHHPGRALDIGCGTGTNVITMAKRGWKVTGVDFAARAIRTAQQKVQQTGVEARLLVGDVTRLEKITGQFDLILDMGCLHGILPEQRQIYYTNLSRWLAPGGIYLLYAFWMDPQAHKQNGLTHEDLLALTARLELVDRQDGTERGRRPSTWFTFQAQEAV